MAVRIRLARHGAKKAPYYRVVVADAHSPRDGRFIEEVGRYNPCSTPTFVKLDLEKINTWVKNGAQPTEIVAKLVANYREVEPAAVPAPASAPAAAAKVEPKAASKPKPKPEPAPAPEGESATPADAADAAVATAESTPAPDAEEASADV